MVLNPMISRLIAGSTFALIASAGAMASAIALPADNHLLSQNFDTQTSDSPSEIAQNEIAQNVDVTEGQMRVRARVASLDAERGFIRVDIQDDEFSPNVDTIYLSGNDINRLGIDVGEELTVVYRDEQAVALIRDDEIVRLQTGDNDVFIAEEEVERPEIAQTTPTPAPTTRPEPQMPPQDTRPAPTYQQQQPQQQPQVIQQEPVPGLW